MHVSIHEAALATGQTDEVIWEWIALGWLRSIPWVDEDGIGYLHGVSLSDAFRVHNTMQAEFAEDSPHPILRRKLELVARHPPDCELGQAVHPIQTASIVSLRRLRSLHVQAARQQSQSEGRTVADAEDA